MPLSILIALGLLGLFLMLRGRSGEAAARTTDPDQATLDELARAGSDLTRRHEVEFFVHLPDAAAAEAVRQQLVGEGFRVEIRTDTPGDWLCLATREMTPALDELRRLRSHLAAVAEARDGAYDGWGTTVVPAGDP